MLFLNQDKGTHMPAHRRHDILDRVEYFFETHCPGKKVTGGTEKDNRLFINTMFWIMRQMLLRENWHPTMGVAATRIGASFAEKNKGIWDKLMGF